MRVIALASAFAALTVLASCQEQDDVVTSADGFTVRSLLPCGTERVGELSLYRELPVIDEGNGYIGFATEEQNATGRNYQRYSLVNCATRSVVRVETEIAAAGTSEASTTLFQRVDALRRGSRLANETLFEASARDAGFSVSTGALPAIGDDRADRVDCGCSRYYRDTMVVN